MLTPVSVIASGWIPFTICTVLSLVFSTIYILWFRSTRERDKCKTTTTVSILSLTVTLMTAALVPVDVFLVSYMKHGDGTYKDWAKDIHVRENLQESVMYTYYVFYGIILTLAFLILPLNFFFHALGDEDDPDDDDYHEYDIVERDSFKKRFVRALKYTCACLFLFAVFVIMGLFIPFDSVPPKETNLTDWQIFEETIEKNIVVDNSKANNLLVFLLNVLSCVGMIILIIYTAYGMSALPFSLINGQRTVYTDRNSVDKEIEDLENRIRLVKAEFDGEESNMNEMDKAHLERLEQQVRLLQRRRRSLDQSARSFVNRCILILRPFQFVLGAVLALFGFLVFLSLLLTSIDKAINSLGPKSGYILQNGTLPNPIDILLVYAQSVFPLDYIMYCTMILFFFFCSITGIQTIGIRFLWISVYKIRSQKTKPQAIVLMCLNLMFILLAINVIMFFVVPDYTTYGDQYFVNNSTKKIEKCNDIEKDESHCDMSRISVLLLEFHYKVWIFGAAYYYLTWLFLIVIAVGAVYKLYEMRKMSQTGSILEEEETEHDDDPDSILS